MAGFKTHVTTSTLFGIGYAGAGIACGLPIASSLVAGGICGVSGMLPDVDSDSGIPIRETTTFAAALVPMLLVDRFRAMGLSYDQMVLAAGTCYLFIRFVASKMLKKYTVHRGMFHSLPAAILFAEVGFLLCGCEDLTLRYYKAGGVLLGVMSHLVLDEIYSIDFSRGIPRLKSSFGTAIKFWGKSLWGNISVYAKLILVTAVVLSEPMMMDRYGAPAHHQIADKAQETGSDVLDKGEETSRTIYDTAKKIIGRFRR